MIWSWYKRRKRLKFCHRLHTGSSLKRYKDPDTGIYYVGSFRYDPAMVVDIVNDLNIECKTAGEK